MSLLRVHERSPRLRDGAQLAGALWVQNTVMLGLSAGLVSALVAGIAVETVASWFEPRARWRARDRR